MQQKLLWLRRHFSVKVASNAWLRCHGCGPRGRTTYHLCGVKQRFLLERFCFSAEAEKKLGALKFKWNIKPAAGNTQCDTRLPCTEFRISVCYRNKWNGIQLKPLTLAISLAVEIRRNCWVLKPRSWLIYLRISIWRTQTGIRPMEGHNQPFPSLFPRRIGLNFYDQVIFPPHSNNCSRFF